MTFLAPLLAEGGAMLGGRIAASGASKLFGEAAAPVAKQLGSIAGRSAVHGAMSAAQGNSTPDE